MRNPLGFRTESNRNPNGLRLPRARARSTSTSTTTSTTGTPRPKAGIHRLGHIAREAATMDGASRMIDGGVR